MTKINRLAASLALLIATPALAWTPRYMPVQPPPQYLAAGQAQDAAGNVRYVGVIVGQVNATCGGGSYNTATSIRTGCTLYPNNPVNPHPGLYTVVYPVGPEIPTWYRNGVKSHELGHVGAHALGTEWVH